MNSSVVTFPARANHLEFQSSLFRHICNGKQLTKLLHAERGIQFAFHDRPHSDQHRTAREFHSGLDRQTAVFSSIAENAELTLSCEVPGPVLSRQRVGGGGGSRMRQRY